MDQIPYKRIDLDQLPKSADGAIPGQRTEPAVMPSRVRWWIIPLSIVLCLAQAMMTILGDNVFSANPTSTFIPVISFGVLFILVWAINPLWALLSRLLSPTGLSRRLNRIELICIFSSMFVTSALSTFGMAAHIVPLIPTPWNPDWNTPQRGWHENLTHPETPLLNPDLYLQDEKAIRGFREGLSIDSENQKLEYPEDGEWKDIVDYYQRVFEAIPWLAWARPVLFWLVFLFGCIGIFYCLAFVVLRFWSEREKLIFPLAQLADSVMPDDNDRRLFPGIVYRGGFWVGFAVSFLVLGWNALVAGGWVVEDFQIPLGMTRTSADALIKGSWIEGLRGNYGSIRFLIVFTGVGIAFLLPKQISFSTWFYFLIGQLMLLIAVWTGVGQNFSDFPSDFTSTANFLTAQGGGALLAFAAISLFRCLREYYLLSIGKAFRDRVRLMIPVIWLGICVTVVVLWLMWNQISLPWALLFVLFFSLFTIGIMRIVAETGIYFFQANFGFFHAFKVLGIGKLVPGAAVAPLLPMYSIFFMDIKTFLAPLVLNAGKMQSDNGHGRKMFHINLLICIVLTALFSIGFMVYMSYLRGGQQMNGWFFNYMAVGNLDSARDIVAGTAEAFSSNGWWVIIGAVWLCITLWLRQSLFWFPHPIGYILLFNPLLAAIWFSFFIGWVIKSIAVKYGGKSSFDMLRPIFIGLIFGELIAILIWMIIGSISGFSSGLTLNRT